MQFNNDSWEEKLKSYQALRDEVQHRLATCPLEEKQAWSTLQRIINERLYHDKSQNNS